MDRDDRDVTGFAMPAENVVHRRIVDSGVDKDGLIFGKVLYQFRKLNDSLPVNLNFPHRRLVLRRLEAALSLVVPSLAYGQCLMGKVEVFGGKSQCFRKAHPRLCYQQDKIVPIHLILQVKRDQQRV